MSDARMQWPQTAAILRHGADFDFYSSGGGGGATYHCGVGGADSIGDGEDSGYTEIPMPSAASADPGLRDRIARLVFRPARQATPQQPLPPPLPSQSSRRHHSGAGNRTATGGFPGYAYTRWECLPSSTPPPPRSAKPAAATSSSQRTVRFRCPREPHRQAPSADEDRWTTVQPYSTFAAGSMPVLGERSASSGYGSDIDIGAAGSADMYAVREEDIDRLLLSSSKPSTAAAPAEADVDVQTLDLTAYFPPAATSPAASNLPQKIERIVGDVVRLKSTALNKSSPRGRRQHQRLDFYDAASIELTDMRPESAARRADVSHRCYYE